MLSTKLTTVDSNILSHNFIPENVRQLVARRTEKGKTFGKLDIIASPPALIAKSDKYPPLNIVTGFNLDTSGSMEGGKIKQAVNTIKQLTQIILAERNGKTLEHQPIHAWIYVISFNSVAELVIPFQEITEETVPGILSQLDNIRVSGSTNYEQAFKKQREVIGNIIQTLTANPDPSKRQFHFIRFFESDGEITQGTNEIDWLYRAMRNTTAATTTATAATTHFTFEDYVIGYGTGVDIECLKQLASPIPPPPQPPKRESGDGMFAEGGKEQDSSSTTSTANSSEAEYNCSTLITVVNAEDIGWQVGEILYKQIMRVGIKLNVSIESKDPSAGVAELFEYQTNQWGTSTTFHSIAHGERKVMYIQYTPTSAPAADATTTPEVIVRVQCENQYTGSKYTYTFSHKSEPSCTLTPLLQRQANSMTPSEIGLAITESDHAKMLVIPIIQGMIHIEVFKQFRELEGTSYNKTVIVREAYNTMLMLKAIDVQTKDQFIHTIAPKTANLITDVKMIIGLTAINDPTEQRCIIHARRATSADDDLFNTGATASRKYVEGEENYKDVAEEIIKKRDAQHRESQQQAIAAAASRAGSDAIPSDAYSGDEADYVSDCLPSRIATCMTPPSSSSHHRHPHHHRNAKRNPPSLLRILCARIALSKLKNEDKTPETIYDEMVMESIHYDGEYNEDPSYFHTRDTPYDDVFSTPSQDDEYSQRRMGMMRQMSSPLS